jgi:hypothetical protein
MNKIIKFFFFIILVNTKIKSNEVTNNTSFLYQFVKGVKGLTPSSNKIITLNYPWLNFVVPIIGVYGLFSALEVLGMHFNLKMPPGLHLGDGTIPWWKIGLTAATLIIQPKWDFHAGLNSFGSTATPGALLDNTIDNVNYALTKYNSNDKDQKDIITKLRNINLETKKIKKMTEAIESLNT